MRSRLYFHLTWTTRDRAPLIELERARFLSHYLPAIAQQERAAILAMGIVSTHVHVLLQLEAVVDIPRLAQRFKGGSARIISKERHGPQHKPLGWAKGYNVESISPRALTSVADYVRTQSTRHPEHAIEGWQGFGLESIGVEVGESPRNSSLE